MNFPLVVMTLVCYRICRTKAEENESLKFVHVIWRHGDRNPQLLFPTDLNTADKWTYGLGELTPLGMRQHYALGQFIKKRYKNFLQEAYSPFEIHVRSSDFNRTIMSALSNLAGMYPLSLEAKRWHPDLPWQPIPVHVVPRKEDKVLFFTVCPSDGRSSDTALEMSSEYQELNEQYQGLFRFLSEKTGYNVSEINSVWKVYDSLNVELIHTDTNPWPDWMNASLFEQIQTLSDYSTRFLYHDELSKRLRAGPLIGEIIDRLLAKVNGVSYKNLKFFAYSGHDVNVLAMLELFGAYDGRLPPYASALFIELHKYDDNYFIETYYKNTTEVPSLDQGLVMVSIEGCEYPCALSTFAHRYKQYVPSDWNAECGLPSAIAPFRSDYRARAKEHGLIGIIVVLAVLVVVQTVFICAWTQTFRKFSGRWLPRFVTERAKKPSSVVPVSQVV